MPQDLANVILKIHTTIIIEAKPIIRLLTAERETSSFPAGWIMKEREKKNGAQTKILVLSV
jgi:hypothetical protein